MSHEARNHNPAPNADMEPNPADAAYDTHGAPRITSPCRITVTHVRGRLADPDGLSIKAVLDGIVQAGVLTNDTPEQIKEIAHCQIKGGTERTIVCIETE